MSRLTAWRPPWRPSLAALAGGAILVAAFPPVDLFLLALVGLVPLFCLASSLPPRQAAVCGWLFGLTLGLGLFYWLTVVMTTYGGLPWPLALLLLVLLQTYLALYPALFCGLLSWLGGRGLSPLWTAPFLWMGLEWVRGQALTGFPWLPLSGALTSFPPLVQPAEWVGATGLSGLIVLLNALLWRAAFPPATPRLGWGRGLAVVAALALVLGGWLGGNARMDQVNQAAQAAPQLPVTVVQANVPLPELWNRALNDEVIRRHLVLTRQAARQQTSRPWLIVWPESAAPFYFAAQARESLPVMQAAEDLDAWISLGSVGALGEPGNYRITNRSWVVSPQGRPEGFYDKVHLVPFGEYVPLPKLFFFVRAVAALSQDLSPGPQGHTLAAGPAILGPLICYESIFPALARAQRQRGSLLMINQTNDAWFGRTSAPAQQLSHLVLRAVENRVACARAANTGISAFVFPDGRLEAQTPLMVQAVATRTLPLLSLPTLFTATGDIAGPLSLTLVVLVVGLMRLRKETGGEPFLRRKKGSPPDPPS